MSKNENNSLSNARTNSMETLKKRFLSLTGFTLLELMIVGVIIGILATLGLSQYITARERALDREAQANLRLILSAERIYRMEDDTGVPGHTYRRTVSSDDTNNWLRLMLPGGNLAAGTPPANWEYTVNIYNRGIPAGGDFCAQAERTRGTVRRWIIWAPIDDAFNPPPGNRTSAYTLDPQPERDQTCP